MLRAFGNEPWKYWDTNLVSARLVNTEDHLTGLVLSKKTLTFFGGVKVTVLHIGKWMGKSVWISPHMGKGKPICGIVFLKQRCGSTW